jgi:hypothetical protein
VTNEVQRHGPGACSGEAEVAFVERPGHPVALVVRDDGIGVGPADRPAGHLLDDPPAAIVFEDDEVAHQI